MRERPEKDGNLGVCIKKPKTRKKSSGAKPQVQHVVREEHPRPAHPRCVSGTNRPPPRNPAAVGSGHPHRASKFGRDFVRMLRIGRSRRESNYAHIKMFLIPPEALMLLQYEQYEQYEHAAAVGRGCKDRPRGRLARKSCAEMHACSGAATPWCRNACR